MRRDSSLIVKVKISPVLHEDVAEGAVEHSVDQVGQAQVEDEQVGHRSHLVMTCHGNP